MSNLEVESIEPVKVPLSFTETGYRSHFTTSGDVEPAGGPVAYVQEWLNWASQSEEWKAADLASRQYPLF